MSIDFGAVPVNSVLPIWWTSHDGATGANETMSALAVGDILIYKGVSLTQRSSTSGFTLLDTDGIDVDTFTGVNAISIDLSDNTDAGFYAAGSFYTVILGPITVDAQTVYTVLATFRIVAAENTAGTPVVDVGRVAGTAQTAGDLKASLNTIDDFVDGLETTIGVAGAGLTAIPWNAAWDAEVESEVDDALGGGTGTALTAIPWNAAWDAEVQSEVDDALVAQRLDELLNADSDIDGVAPPTVGSVVHELLSKTAGSFTYDQTTDSLEAIRDKETDIETDTAEIGAAGAGLTAINLPNQTMDITGNLSGSVGSVTGAVGSVTGAVGSVTGLTAATVHADLDDIQARLPAALVGGRIDASVGAVAAAAIGAAAFAAGALDAVWSTAARVLTAGTNIVLAKGVGLTGLNDLSAANVNAEVVDALATDTYAEPGQGAPAATASLSTKVGWLYKLMRNRITQTATTLSIYNDDAVTVDTKSTVSDNGTTYDRGELVSGP